METIYSEIPEQLGYQIITDKHIPLYHFYRFKVYELQDYLQLAPEEKRKRLLYQIEGNNLKVVARFFLDDKKEI